VYKRQVLYWSRWGDIMDGRRATLESVTAQFSMMHFRRRQSAAPREMSALVSPCFTASSAACRCARAHRPQAPPAAAPAVSCRRRFRRRHSRLVSSAAHCAGHPAGVTLRKGEKGDTLAIAQLLTECGSTWSLSNVTDEFKRPTSHVVVATAAPTSHVVVATAAGDQQVVGVCVAWKVVGDCHVMELGVSPSFRRRGIATHLLEAAVDVACDKAQGCHTLLEVRESNSHARALYAQLGFHEVGNRPRYYPNGEAAVLCTRVEGPRTGAG
jgi:ribosomal protein S18 acetylase RimI-like enzyme